MKPASARHKRGCTCKKCHCQNKYCECNQAGVGCTDGCQCEGCKNVHGKREASAIYKRERGSTCKRCLCQNKWCECNQAGVGCSDVCQCEGCNNVYGKREAVEIMLDNSRHECAHGDRNAFAASENSPLRKWLKSEKPTEGGTQSCSIFSPSFVQPSPSIGD
ncbi:uncharacterized protein LOC143847208 isoform X1 [Tasmannia lanceolata]|uniref:uncharacterized protein LOC143847208 isoform X1 n=1 Tax=Tasmannia lanceolata TaxID=3420 RepID=UPI004062E724